MTTARTSPETLDRRFQALSDPKRRRILALLGDGEMCVCELVDEIEVSQSLLSFHLKALKEAELVDDRRDGRWVHYRLRSEALVQVREHLRSLSPRADGEADPATGGGAEGGAAADGRSNAGNGNGRVYRCC